MAQTKRVRVYVQVFDRVSHRWSNYMSKPTFEEAEELLRNLQEQYPEAKLRILDNNKVTHTK